LLHRWAEADPKPKLQASIRNVGIDSTVFYLQWTTEILGPRALQSLVASDPESARRFVAAFTAHANERIDHYSIGPPWSGLAALMSDAVARHWRAVKERVLGPALTIEGRAIELPPRRSGRRAPHR